MMRGIDDFKGEIDWDVYKKQQSVPKEMKGNNEEFDDHHESYNQDISLNNKASGKVSTFLGRMEKPTRENLFNPEIVHGLIDTMAGNPGMKILGAASGASHAIPAIAGKAAGKAKEYGQKVTDYFQPGKEAERFRGTFGEGTSAENIEQLGKRVQFAKQSAQEEALIPKRELYKQEGKSDVYEVGKEHLPEGNIPKMAEMIAPGEKFGESESKALSKAIKDYRVGKKNNKGEWVIRPGDITSFVDKSEEIFGVPDLPEKAISKLEDALLLPTKRESAYLSEKGVTDFYGKKGLKTLHDEYASNPTLANYDTLQSAIKKEIRKLKSKGKSLDSLGEEKLEALTENVKNLNADKEAFMSTLPEKMQNLENEFRYKYATGVGKYEEAPLAMRKLAEGRASEVSTSQIENLFTKPTKEVKAILKDLGESAGKNIIYNALQKVPLHNAAKMADTIIDLKRTKGYDHFITPEMEQWAKNMKRRIFMTKGLQTALSAGLGASIFGGYGAAVGAAAPHAPAVLKYASKKFMK